MSIMSDLHIGIYTDNNKKDKQTYLEAITGSKENVDVAVDENTSGVNDNTDCIENVNNPFVKAMLQKAMDNHIEVGAEPEPETLSSINDNIDCTENAGNSLLKALLQRAVDSNIEVGVEPEPKEVPTERDEDNPAVKKAIDRAVAVGADPRIIASIPAIIAGLKLLEENSMKEYQPVNIDMKMIERNSHHYKLSEKAKEFCQFISATPEYANSCKQVYSHNKGKDIVKLLSFFKQNGEGNSFEFIHTTRFYRHLDYYVTKNSFFANERKAENLFSFDNIVIDVDNHAKENEAELTKEQLNKEIKKIVSCLRAEELNFPEFSYVHSGRGVQIWIRLVSFSAIPDKMKRLYDIICRKLCGIVEKVIEDNNINLEVDTAPSVDATRLLRLPYTWNTKVDRKATFEKCTDRRYGLTELCERFGIKRKSEDKKKDKQKSEPKPMEWTVDTPLLYKRTAFIMELSTINNGYCKSRRNSMLYLYYNYCLQLYDISNAQMKLQQLNNSFKEPVKQSQINTIFREFEEKSQKESPFYKYSKAKFLDELNLTASERLMYTNFMSREAERAEAREAKAKRNQTIVTMWEQGYTQQQIADTVSCHISTVNRLLKEYKPEIKQKTTKKTGGTQKTKLVNPVRKDVEKPTIELYNQGYKQKEIAKKLGVAESTVSDILKPYKSKKSERNQTIIELSQQGYTQQQIADMVECGKSTVIRVLNAYKENKSDDVVNTPAPKSNKPVKVIPARLKAPPLISKELLNKLPKDEREVFIKLLTSLTPEAEEHQSG